MIEKMLKTTIICRKEDREKTLLSLRNLGVLHVNQIQKPESQILTDIEQALDRQIKIVNILSEYENAEADPYSKKSPRALSKMALENYDRLSEAKKTLNHLYRERALLEPWGNFSISQIDSLKEKGVHVYLCVANNRNVSSFEKYGTVEIIKHVKEKTYFALISDSKQPKEELPIVSLPSSRLSLAELDEKIEKNKQVIQDCTSELQSIAQSINEIKLYQKEIQQQYEFIYNKHGMGEADTLTYITGFIPAKKKNRISRAAMKCGWAATFEAPSADDTVPTLLNIPKVFSIIRPVFKFIGISPGYNEWDVSICFLFFFTIFFGMIVGDAGYGILFLIVGIALKIIFKRKREMRVPLNLFLVLSIATIIWGALTCTYFGLPHKVLPGDMQGLKPLTNPKTKNDTMLFICFTLGAIHLSLARVWKTIIYSNKLKALGQLGWGLFIWGNYFTALKLIVYSKMEFPTIAFYLYGIGFVLIILFYIQWNDAGSIFNTPFDFIGSFVDLLSYIRLFAVGLATLYIAMSFNNMGKMVYELSPWFLVFAMLIIALGHLLNIALAFMGVLVHGIRLNTLEFSNHMELEWSGFFYNPFKRHIRDRSKDELTNN
ncbi:MAG: hypothetical protein K9L78_03090 [Victivallales bacterium]|nr:hypothetical protein [Victivallales bacterium]MCF7889083.1 hypothetical protein [Victivallales bacterium]